MSPRPQSPPVSLRVTPLEDRRVPANFYSTLFTTEHIDLQADYTGSSWRVGYTNFGSPTLPGGGFFGGGLTVADNAFYVPPSARVATPAGANFGFLGAGAGGLAYILPEAQNPELPWLGISSTGSFPGTLTAYQPNDARAVGSKAWVRFDITAVRGPGRVSIYQTSPTGTPTNWVASADGLTAKDAVYLVAGEVEQYSWAFTQPGVYQIDVTATGFRGANQTLPITSALQTMSFAVDAPGPVNTVPASGATSTGGKPIIFTTGGNSISVAGPVVAPAPVQTTLTVRNGTLTLGTTAEVGVVSGDASANVVVTGTVDQVNKAVNGLIYTPNPGFNGVETVTVATTDRGAYRPATVNEQTDTDTFGILVTGNPAAGQLPPGTVPPVAPPTFPPGSSQNLPRTTAIGAPVGSGAVSVVDTETGETVTTFSPYEASFTGGVRVAVADFRKTGVPEIVTAPASGGAARVQVFGTLGQPARLNFFAFDPGFVGGVSLATADVNGDTFPDIIVGAGFGGGPRVSVFDGRTGTLFRTFFAFESGFRGGVSVAAGDVNADGFTDIVVGAGPGGGPAVAVFDGANPANVRRFFAYDPNFRGGVNVAVGNVTGSAAAEIVVGAGAGGGPHVQVFDGTTFANTASFFATPVTPQTVNGVQVSVSDLRRDLVPEILTATPVGLTEPARLRAFDLSVNPFRPQASDLALTDSFNGGVYVAGVV